MKTFAIRLVGKRGYHIGVLQPYESKANKQGVGPIEPDQNLAQIFYL